MSAPVLCTLGHIATTRDLASHGISAWRIRAAILEGRIQRLRRGIYGCGHAPRSTSRAASVAGSITCVSVLREAGVWAGDSRLLHVQLKPGSARPTHPDMKFHWEHPRFPMETA